MKRTKFDSLKGFWGYGSPVVKNDLIIHCAEDVYDDGRSSACRLHNIAQATNGRIRNRIIAEHEGTRTIPNPRGIASSFRVMRKIQKRLVALNSKGRIGKELLDMCGVVFTSCGLKP